mgnify:CR=1 FL=1
MDTYTSHLTSLEYFGLETLFRHLITEYGSTYQGEGANLDFRRTQQGVSVYITSAALPQWNSS